MNIFILDKDLKVLHTLNSKGDGINTSPFFNDEYVQYLETGAETFEFSTLQHESIDIGNYIAFTYNGESKLFQISEIEEEHNESFEVKVYCEVAGLELTYEILRPREIPSANIKQYLQNVLSETDWEVGYIDDDVQLVHTINIEDYVEVYNHIQETILKYECEISFRVVRNGSRVTHKYIDVYKQRGTKSRFRFDYKFNMSNVKRTKKSDTLATALVGVGKDNVNFKTVEWKKSEGDPCDKPLGQDFIEDTIAFNRWNTNGKHLMGRFKCDSESPQELLRLTWNSLQERKNPKMEYSMDISLLTDEEVFIGDEVYVIDNEFVPSLWLSARVNELHLSFTDKTKNTCSFCNYKEVKSKIKNDSFGLLQQINNSMFMGISKGGFLNSNLKVDGFNIKVRNKYVNDSGEEYYFDIRKKKATDFLTNISNASVKITQSFVIDTVDMCIYSTQVEDNNSTGNLILSKLDFSGKVLGKMYLKEFGHGNQIGIDRIDGIPKIWVECDGEIASGGSFSGKKICRFEFIDGKTCYYHEGNVYDLAPTGSAYITVAINEESDRLGIRYKHNGNFYYSIYSLYSVLNNNPTLLATVLRPSSLETTSKSPNQGFAIFNNRIYNYEGFPYEETDNKSNIRISCIDFKGVLLYSHYIDHAMNLVYREPEGLFFKQISDTDFELYFGIASGNAGSRKFNIYKYSDTVGSDYQKRGSFMHNNGHTCSINECDIITEYDGSQRRKSYLLYVNKLSRFVDYNNFKYFIVAEFKNGKWLHNGVEFESDVNDAIVGEIQETANGTNLTLYTYDYEAVRGQDGVNGVGISSMVEQYYLSTSQTALSGGSWSTTVPTWQQGKYIWTRSAITYTDNTTTTTNGICVSGGKGDKGETGTNGTSPVLVTISGQQSMKYLDKTSAPTPSTITLTANVMEGNVAVSSGITYVWQYKNSGGTWVNLSGTYTNKTYSLAYDNSGFINEVAQVRVAVSYKNQTYYLEHTVTKIYDNKYISKQEVFDKITEGGTNQLIYKDPDTGEIYINATFIKSGQLLADIIKGGILTLGGTIGLDNNPVNGYIRVLGADNQELAVLNGGDMTINGFSSDEATIDNLYVQDIKSPKIATTVTENTTIYVNQATGNDDADFDNGAVYQTIQGAIDATPKNLNGFDVYIRLQGTSSGGIHTYSENLTYKGFYGGSLYTYLQKNYVHGYVVMRDCSARMSLVGGSNYDEIPDDPETYERANIKPASLYTTGNTYYAICAINCTDVYIRALDLWGSTATNSNGYPNYAVGVREGSNVFVRNVKIHSSTNGFHAQVMGRLFAVNTYGKVTNYAYRCTYGGWMNIGSGNSVSGGSSSLNISTGDGCQILQGNVTWDGSSSTGTNDNTTVNSNTTTYNATSGDSWKVKYSSWRKDNTVRQGDWSGTGMHKGCWFFGSQFNDIKGKTIKSIKLTIQRQSSGGNSGAVAFTLKMHNHTGRPSGAPSYLSGWSKNVSLSLGQSSTITITDSAVLTAIKNGTMKGFGVEVSSTSNSYYGILSPKLKAVVIYS